MLQKLKRDLQELEWSKILPLKESLMFLSGQNYRNGSDYPKEILEMTLEDCPHCENTGTKYVPNGLDDVDAEPCGCIYGEIGLFNNELEAYYL